MQNSNNFDLGSIKSKKSIDLLANEALQELDNSTDFVSSPEKVQLVFAKWNEILQQQKQENRVENEKIKCLEKKLARYFKDTSSFTKLQEMAKASLFTQVESYLTTYTKIEQALQKNWAGTIVQEKELCAIVNISNFPLTAPLDDEGNTLLHKLLQRGLNNPAEHLVKKCPLAIDVPNDAFELPVNNIRNFCEEQATLKKYVEEKEKGLDWAIKQPEWKANYPNQVMLWLQQAILDGKMTDSALCQ